MMNFSAAKSIVDFYITKLNEDSDNAGAQFALQYSNLHLLRLRTSSSLDALESYDIEVNNG